MANVGNLCTMTRFRAFNPSLRTIDQKGGGGGGGEGVKYTFLERSLHWESKKFKIRAIEATREKFLR